MTVYEKLAKARIDFQSKGVKKSGKNSYAGYEYFELADILPACNQICADVKAVCVVSFTDTVATLDFIDSEKPTDKITFTSPMSKATLKGCHDVQNLGAVETYIKRYLYQNCFEISEGDVLDSTMNPNEQKQPSQPPKDKGGNAPQQSAPKRWSKEQADAMGAVLATEYDDGTPVFSEKDKEGFRKMCKSGADFQTSLKQARDTLAQRLKNKKAEKQSEESKEAVEDKPEPSDIF